VEEELLTSPCQLWRIYFVTRYGDGGNEGKGEMRRRGEREGRIGVNKVDAE
jgi:hypothetical protein